jgi:NADH-quinone oxidoreductase subunit J
MEISTAVFYLVAIITVGSAAMVAFSRNIIYSAFSLLGAFGGVAGIYVFLGADFVAAVQLLIYVGGILVLVLFAVMLDNRILTLRSLIALPGIQVFIYRRVLYLLVGRVRHLDQGQSGLQSHHRHHL